MTIRRFHPAGSLASGPYELLVTPGTAGWRYAGLQIVCLPPGGSHEAHTGGSEMAVLPLRGGCHVEVDGRAFTLEGRESVFARISDFAYVPRDAEVRLVSPHGAELALCTAPARRRLDAYRVAAAQVPVEVRGGGPATRQIVNFLSADSFEADRLIAVEVITPEGGWSSYPPHKHDTTSADEVELEEIYHFRVEGDAGFGFFTCYAADGSFHDTVTVRDGDTYLVPRGYHGPAAAAPGHHMWYLNVMAGPAEERVWRFCDDPSHAWTRPVLDELAPDPRLPLTTAEGRKEER